MTTVTNESLVQFRDFLNEKLAEPQDTTTPAEALDEFLAMHDTPEEREDALEAVRESMAEIRSGAPGRPVAEVLAEIRQRFGWVRSP